LGLGKSVLRCFYVLVLVAGVLGIAGVGWAAVNESLPAFPGAEGYGSTTVGGRGGQVIEVTNLNDSGPGSLRAAIDASGPRVVVFRVGGTINLFTSLEVRNPYVTIAGQTAPGGGITLKNDPSNTHTTLAVYTHDVVVRYIRLRSGPSTLKTGDLDSLRVSDNGGAVPPVYNVVIDHVSASWAVDETVQIGGGATDVTIQWSVISEGLNKSVNPDGAHSCGLLLRLANSSRISVHHNLFAHNRWRNPQVSNGGQTDVENNVVYDWEWKAISANDSNGARITLNALGNYIKPGPSSSLTYHEIDLNPYNTLAGFDLYPSGNIGPYRSSDLQPDTDSVEPADVQYVVPAPVFTAPPITTTPAARAYEDVLAGAGDTIPERDAVDLRVLSDVRNGTGSLIDNPSQVGGWPDLAPGTPPEDSDHDGMPDPWELQYFGALDRGSSSDSSSDADADGYTDLEEYLNGTTPVDAPAQQDLPPAIPTGLDATPGDGNVELSWNPNSEPDLAGYEVRYATPESTTWAELTNIAPDATSSFIDGLVNDTSYDFEIRARDGAGNLSEWSAPVRATPIAPDTSAPTVAITDPVDGGRVQAAATVSATASDDRDVTEVDFFVDGALAATDSTSPYGFRWNTTGLPLGSTSTLTATASDAAGNTGVSAPVAETIVDTTPPSVAITEPGDGQAVGGVVTVTATASDDRQVAEVAFFVDGALTATDTSSPYDFSWDTVGLPLGSSHMLVAIASDAAGNFELAAPVTLTVVDTAAPAAPSGVSATPGDGEVTVAWEPNTEPDLDGYELRYAPTGTSAWEIQSGIPAVAESSTITGLTNDTPYDFQVRARDTAGNVSPWSATVEAIPTAPDLVPPSVVITDPTEGTRVKGSVTVAADASDDKAVATVEFFVDDTLAATDSTSPYGFSWDTGSLPAGSSHTLTATATDIVGKVGTSTQVSVTIADTTAPSVAVTAPVAGAQVQGSVAVSASASDDLAVSAVGFFVDGTLLATDATSPYGFTWNTDGLPVGSSHTIVATAYDAAENQGTSAPVTVTIIDTRKPTISSVTVTNITRTGATVSWTTNEPSTSQVKYGTTTSYGKKTSLVGTLVLSHRVTLSGLRSKTTYHFSVMSQDAVGNLAASADHTFTTLR
jgi:chitodextrinase